MANQRTPAAVWRDRVAQWHASGASVHAYADEHGLPAIRLNYWVRRVQREAQSAQMVPVRIQQPVTAAAGLELHSPSGWTMRFDPRVEPAWLAALLSGLR
jgi:transposase-like protein